MVALSVEVEKYPGDDLAGIGQPILYGSFVHVPSWPTLRRGKLERSAIVSRPQYGAPMKPPPTAPARPFPRIWLDAVCSRNLGRLVELHLPTATVLVPYLPQPLQGRQALRTGLAPLVEREALAGSLEAGIDHRLGRRGVLYAGRLTLGWRARGVPTREAYHYSFLVVPTRHGARALHVHLAPRPKRR